MNSLGNNYSSEVICDVTYKNQPKGKVVLNDLPKEFKIEIKGLGFDLLALKMSFNHPQVSIDLQKLGVLNGTQKISSIRYATAISNQLGDNIEIKSILPESINLMLDDQMEKTVKVIPQTNLKFKKQYQLFGQILSKPVITKISGPKMIIDTITQVSTSLIEKEELSSTLTESIGFDKKYELLKIKFNPSKVLVHIPVEKFTETAQRAMIEVVNLPDSIKLKTIPHEVEIKFQLPLSKMANLASANFKVEVDYNAIRERFSHKLKINLVEYPDYIQNISLTPEKVEYIIKK
ncbi:MAG: hypothetical protein P1U41_03815 [Vicingaceae bacterium]|nr:hypothetical protein [Vicingaceae bacterium]